MAGQHAAAAHSTSGRAAIHQLYDLFLQLHTLHLFLFTRWPLLQHDPKPDGSPSALVVKLKHDPCLSLSGAAAGGPPCITAGTKSESASPACFDCLIVPGCYCGTDSQTLSLTHTQCRRPTTRRYLSSSVLHHLRPSPTSHQSPITSHPSPVTSPLQRTTPCSPAPASPPFHHPWHATRYRRSGCRLLIARNTRGRASGATANCTAARCAVVLIRAHCWSWSGLVWLNALAESPALLSDAPGSWRRPSSLSTVSSHTSSCCRGVFLSGPICPPLPRHHRLRL